jgi:hypothetical protein
VILQQSEVGLGRSVGLSIVILQRLIDHRISSGPRLFYCASICLAIAASSSCQSSSSSRASQYHWLDRIMTAELAATGPGSGGASSSSGDGTSASRPPFHLDIHAWVETHGVRHDDYAQYHAYCTRRLARLARSPSDARPYLVHSSKYASTSSSTSSSGGNKAKGSRHAFCSRSHDTFAPVEADDGTTEEDGAAADGGGGGGGDDDDTGATRKTYRVPHVNILWHLLVSAERCWAQANDLQKAGKATGKGNGAGGGGAAGRRQHVIRKLKRANEWATLLLEMSTGGCTDATTQRECQAYSAWMTANLALEKMKYQVGLSCYLSFWHFIFMSFCCRHPQCPLSFPDSI